MSFLSVLEATMRGADALTRQIAGGLSRTNLYRRFRTTGALRMYAHFHVEGWAAVAHG